MQVKIKEKKGTSQRGKKRQPRKKKKMAIGAKFETGVGKTDGFRKGKKRKGRRRGRP